MAISDPGHLAMEKDLRKAIAHKELLLHYQPIIELKTGRVTSAEALVRWQHPSLGLLLPSMFIPYAEESGLIVKLGEWVFAEACRQLKIWRRAGINTTMSINISARELLQKDMIRKMQRIVRKYKLSPKDIALEVTETFLVKNMETSTKMLKEVRALGFKTSLDGFGTGYASLNYLKQLPVDYIKIDHPLVVGSVTNTQDAGIVQAIIAVAHHLHIKVVAEGGENDSQLRFFLKHDLGFKPRVVCARQPQGFFTQHALVADHDVLQCHTQSMAHMWRGVGIERGHDDGEGFALEIVGIEITGRLPHLINFGLLGLVVSC